jgi:hypothetical protein
MRGRNPDECLARAAEYERLADTTTNADAREILLLLADRWTTLAEDEAVTPARKGAGGSGAAIH